MTEGECTAFVFLFFQHSALFSTVFFENQKPAGSRLRVLQAVFCLSCFSVKTNRGKVFLNRLRRPFPFFEKGQSTGKQLRCKRETTAKIARCPFFLQLDLGIQRLFCRIFLRRTLARRLADRVRLRSAAVAVIIPTEIAVSSAVSGRTAALAV